MKTYALPQSIKLVFGICSIIFSSTVCLAEEISSSEPKQSEPEKNVQEKILERITVVGSEEKKTVPGSAYLLQGKRLEEAKTGYNDIHRVLREVPGVNIQEEDGYGLRPNIGFRGTPTERSDAITLMEDGVLIAPAPYSAPAAYYFPTTGRMDGVEVLKGASQIKYGPRTVGGSLNLISGAIPHDLTLKGNLAAGDDSTKKLQARAGDSYKYGGWMAETYQIETNGFKELDGGGDTGYELEDYLGKFQLNTNPESPYYQQVEFKIGYTDQDSNETYLGLTQEDFDRKSNRRYLASQLDNLTVEHEQYQVQHYGELSDNLDVTTTAYYNDTSRAWYKLESVQGSSLSNILDNPEDFSEQLEIIKGADSPDDALSIRDNNREYYSKGIQTVVAGKFETGEIKHAVEAGARFHSDEEDRFQRDDKYKMEGGKLILTTEGKPGSQANRVGSADAWAFYVQDAVEMSALTVTPGLRYENINYTVENYGVNDPDRTGVALSRNDTDVDAVIPGVGVHYQVTDEVSAYGGVHKGFSPPGPTTDDSVDEEESVNYELGVGYAKDSLNSDLVLFYTDYDNLLGADTLSSGGTGSGDLFNGGAATVYGVEAAVRYDFAEPLELAVKIPTYISYTFTSAEFDSNFDSDFFGEVSDGDDIPYIPDNQLAFGTGVHHEKWGRISLRSHYVNAMKTAAGEAGESDASKTDAYFVFDITAETPVYEQASLFVDILNLFDEEYVVARRPAGARPGLPFTLLAGVKFEL